MNYIDRIACDIFIIAEDSIGNPLFITDSELALYRIYAVLALAKGESTTMRDVHDAWSAWAAATDNYPDHRSLIPFDQLSPDVQALDEPYMRAIHQAARVFVGKEVLC